MPRGDQPSARDSTNQQQQGGGGHHHPTLHIGPRRRHDVLYYRSTTGNVRHRRSLQRLTRNSRTRGGKGTVRRTTATEGRGTSSGRAQGAAHVADLAWSSRRTRGDRDCVLLLFLQEESAAQAGHDG